jgi:hypothetical protein
MTPRQLSRWATIFCYHQVSHGGFTRFRLLAAAETTYLLLPFCCVMVWCRERPWITGRNRRRMDLTHTDLADRYLCYIASTNHFCINWPRGRFGFISRTSSTFTSSSGPLFWAKVGDQRVPLASRHIPARPVSHDFDLLLRLNTAGTVISQFESGMTRGGNAVVHVRILKALTPIAPVDASYDGYVPMPTVGDLPRNPSGEPVQVQITGSQSALAILLRGVPGGGLH